MNNRWGFVFSVDTRDFAKLTRSYKQVEQITDRVEKVRTSLSGTVSQLAGEIKTNVAVIREAVRGLEDVVKSTRQAVTSSAPMGHRQAPNYPQATSRFQVEGRVRDFFKSELGISRAMYERYSRPYVRTRVSAADPGNPDKMIRKWEYKLDEQGRKIRNNPSGGRFVQPTKDPETGRMGYSVLGLATNAVRGLITGPLTRELRGIRREIRDKSFGGPRVNQQVNTPNLAGGPPPPSAAPVPRNRRPQQQRPASTPLPAQEPAAPRMGNRELIYHSLAQKVAPNQYSQFVKNPQKHAEQVLKNSGWFRDNPQLGGAAVQGVVKSAFKDKTRSMAEVFTDIMAVAQSAQSSKFSELVKSAQRMVPGKMNPTTKASMVGEMLPSLIGDQIRTQVLAGAGYAHTMRADPGPVMRSVESRYKLATTQLGTTRSKVGKGGDDHEHVSVMSLQKRGTEPSPIFDDSILPRPEGRPKSHISFEESYGQRNSTQNKSAGGRTENEPSAKPSFAASHSNYSLSKSDQEAITAAQHAADEAAVPHGFHRDNLVMAKLISDTLRGGVASGKVDPTARSGGKTPNAFVTGGEPFERLFAMYRHIGGTEEPDRLKEQLLRNAGNIAQWTALKGVESSNISDAKAGSGDAVVNPVSQPKRKRVKSEVVGAGQPGYASTSIAGQPIFQGQSLREVLGMSPLGVNPTQTSPKIYEMAAHSKEKLLAGNEIPEMLYHATPHLPDVLKSGILKGFSTTKRGGLGSEGMHGVSFSPNETDAILISRELQRVGQLSKASGPGVAERLMQRWSKHDDLLSNTKSGTAAMRDVGGLLDGLSPDNWKGEILKRYTKRYLPARQKHGGLFDPNFTSDVDSYSQIDPKAVGYVGVPKSAIPAGAVVKRGAETGIDEVRVRADVPLITGTTAHATALIRVLNKLDGHLMGPGTGDTASSRGGHAFSLRDRTIEEHMDEAVGLKSFDKQGKFSGRFRNAVGRVATYGGGAAAVYGGVSAIKNGIGEAVTFEKTMTDIRRVINPVDSDIKKLGDSAKSMGVEFGVSNTEVAKGMTIFAQQGLGMRDIIDQTRTAVMATNVTEMALEETTEALTAAQKQFGFTTKQSGQILDSWVEVADTTSVNSRVLTEALKRSGTAARAAGIDFHMFNGITAAMGEATRKGGNEIGTAMKFIFQHARDPKAIDAMQKVGIATQDAFGNMRSGRETMGELSTRWDRLTDAQKQNVAVSIAGTRHLNDFFVMMETWERAVDVSVTSLTSQGSAARKNEIAMQSLDKKIGQLKASYQGMWQSLGESGALDVLKNVTDSLRGVIDLAGKANKATGGVLGGLAGSLAVGGVGMMGASWLGGHFLPEVVGGGFTPKGIAELSAKKGPGGRGMGGTAASIAGGVGSDTYFTRGRMASAGLIAAGGLVQGTYNGYFRQAKDGDAPTRRDFAVDAGASAAQTVGLIGLLKKSGGMSIGNQGVGRSLMLALIAAQGAGSLYGKYQQYRNNANPDSSEGKLNRFEQIRAMEEKYYGGRSTLTGYLRQVKSGQATEDMDPARLQDMRDMVAALEPSLVQFNKSGEILTKDIEQWAAGLTTAGAKFRTERADLLRAAISADLGTTATKDLITKRDDLIGKRSRYSDDTPLEERLGTQSELGAVNEQLRGKFYNPVIAQSQLQGLSGNGISPFGRGEVEKYAGITGMSPEAMQTEILRRGMQGASGNLIDVGRALKSDGKSAFDVKYFRKQTDGAVYDAGSGRMVAGEGAEANKFAKNNYVFNPSGKFKAGVVIGPDAQLSKLLNAMTQAMDRLTAKNQQLILSAEFSSRQQSAGVFTRGTSGLDLQTLLRSGRALSDIAGGSKKVFTGTVTTDTHILQEQMRQLIGQATAAGDGSHALAPEGLVNTQSELIRRGGQFREMSEGWLGQLIKSGGAVVDTTHAGDPEADAAGMTRPFQSIVEAFDEEFGAQLKNYAEKIAALRDPKNASTDNLDKASQLEKASYDLLRSRLAQKLDPAIQKVSEHLKEFSERSAGFARSTVETLGGQYNADRSAGRVGSFEEFAKQPEVEAAIKLLKDNAEALARTLDAQKDAYDELKDSAEASPAALDAMRRQIDETSITLQTERGVLGNLGKTVHNLEFGMRQLGREMERSIARAGNGGAYGLSGNNAGQYAINELQKSIDQLVVKMEALPKDAYTERGNVQEQIARYRSAIEEQQNRQNELRDRRTDAVKGLQQSVLTRRMNAAAGIYEGGGSQDFVTAIKDQFSELNQKIAEALTPAMKGMKPEQVSEVLRNINKVMGPMSSRMNALMTSTDAGYMKAYSTASLGDQSAADYVQSLAGKGMGMRDILQSDPSLKYAFQNNPLLGQLGDKLAANEADRAAEKYAEETAKGVEQTNKILTDIFGVVNGTRQQQGLDAVPVPKMSVGSMSLSGSAAVDQKGRIRTDGTPAILHEGEIVLNKRQSDAFLRNQFAKGTLPAAASTGGSSDPMHPLAKEFYRAIGESGAQVQLSKADPTMAAELLASSKSKLASLSHKLGLNPELTKGLFGTVDTVIGDAVRAGQHGSGANKALYTYAKFGASNQGVWSRTRDPLIQIASVSKDRSLTHQVGEAAGYASHELGHHMNATGRYVYGMVGTTGPGAEFRKLFDQVHAQEMAMVMSDTSRTGQLSRAAVHSSYGDSFKLIQELADRGHLGKTMGGMGPGFDVLAEAQSHMSELSTRPGYRLASQFKKMNAIRGQMTLKFWEMTKGGKIDPSALAGEMLPFMKQLSSVTSKYSAANPSNYDEFVNHWMNGNDYRVRGKGFKLPTVGEAFGGVMGKVGKAMRGTAGTTTNGLKGAYNSVRGFSLKNAIGGGLSRIPELAEWMIGTAAPAPFNLMGSLADKSANVLRGLPGQVAGAGRSVGDFVGRMGSGWEAIANDTLRLKKGLYPKTSMLRKVSDAGEWFGKLPGRIGGAGEAAMDTLHGGADLASGVVNGFGDRVANFNYRGAAASAGRFITSVPGRVGRGLGRLGGLGEAFSSRFPRLSRAGGGLGTYGLLAADFFGQKVANNFGVGEGWRNTGGLAAHDAGLLMLSRGLQAGHGLLPFGLESRPLKWAGESVAAMGESMQGVKFLNRAGRGVEMLGEGMSLGGRGIMGATKLAGRALEPLMLAQTALDVNRVGTYTANKLGIIGDQTAKNTRGSLDSVGSGMLYHSGIEWAGSKFSDSWKQSMDDSASGIKILEEQISRQGFGDDSWIPSTAVRDIGRDLAHADSMTDMRDVDHLRRTALKTPLLVFAKDVLAEKMQGKNSTTGGLPDWVSQAIDSNPLQAQGKLLDATEKQLNGILQNYVTAGGDPSTIEAMKGRLQALAERKQAVLAASKMGGDSIGDYFAAAGSLDAAKKVREGTRQGGKMTGGQGEGWDKFAQMALSLPDDVARDALRTGGFRAYKALAGDGEEEIAKAWAEAASRMPVTATAGDLFKGLVRVKHQQMDDGTDRRYVDSNGIKDVNAALSLGASLAKSAANRSSLSDLSPFARAETSLNAGKQFSALMNWLPGGVSAYEGQHQSLAAAADALQSQLQYTYTKGADPAAIAEKKKLYQAQFNKLVSQYDQTASLYRDITSGAGKADGLFGSLTDSQKKAWAKGDKKDIWSMAGVTTPASLSDVEPKLGALKDWASKADQDAAQWAGAIEARKWANQSASDYKASLSAPKIVGGLRRGEDGSIHQVARLVGGQANSYGEMQQAVQDGWKRVMAKNAAGGDTLSAIRAGVMGGGFKTTDDLMAAVAANPDLQSAMNRYNSYAEASKGYKAGASAMDDSALSAISSQRSDFLRTTSFSKETLDSVNRMAEAFQKRVDADKHLESIKKSMVHIESTSDFNSRNGTDQGDWKDVPGFRSGTSMQAGSKAVDEFGRIRSDGTPAVLHEGEIVLNKRQSDAFLRNQFEKGTARYDPMSIEAGQFGESVGKANGFGSTVTHSGEIILTPGADMMGLMQKVLNLLQTQQGGKGPAFRLGEPIDDRYA